MWVDLWFPPTQKNNLLIRIDFRLCFSTPLFCFRLVLHRNPPPHAHQSPVPPRRPRRPRRHTIRRNTTITSTSTSNSNMARPPAAAWAAAAVAPLRTVIMVWPALGRPVAATITAVRPRPKRVSLQHHPPPEFGRTCERARVVRSHSVLHASKYRISVASSRSPTPHTYACSSCCTAPHQTIICTINHLQQTMFFFVLGFTLCLTVSHSRTLRL